MSIHDDDGMRSRVEADAAAEEQAQAESEQAQAESEDNQQEDPRQPGPQTSPPNPRVTHIGLSRLFNLGNYENIKFDVSVEVPEGQSAALTLSMLLKILQKLRPLKQSYEVTRAIRILNTPETELSETERGNLEEYRALVDAHAIRVQERKEALQKLDALGGTSTEKDAKDSWEFEDDYED